MVVFRHQGNFDHTEKFLNRAKSLDYRYILSQYGQQGVKALASATPVDTGLTANSWDYRIDISRTSVSITWTNTNIVDGVPIAIILQYGHATGTGGYVQGQDYINPAIKPIFKSIEEALWREVTSS